MGIENRLIRDGWRMQGDSTKIFFGGSGTMVGLTGLRRMRENLMNIDSSHQINLTSSSTWASFVDQLLYLLFI